MPNNTATQTENQQRYSFKTVAQTQVGAGSLSTVFEACERLSISHPIIVTDRGIAEAGLLRKLTYIFDEHAVTYQLFDQVLADPPEQNILDVVEWAKINACDGVIGFGGGSSMDVAKLGAAMLAGDQSLSQMYGVEKITGARLPLIQIPTTAGTGSEATAVSIVTTGKSSKAGVVSSVLFADQIILDPELTLGLPPHVTAATGIDAMVHAIEAFTSVRLKNPLSDMVALQALRLLSVNIETAVFDGNNLSARSDMLLGAMLAGQAFANAPVGAVHALAYPLGGTFHIAHGLSNSLMLPHVLRFNAPSCPELYSKVASVIHGLEFDVQHAENAGEALASYFYELAVRLKLPTQLKQVDISQDALPELAKLAMDQQRLLINNPRVVTEQDAFELYTQAY